MEYLTNTSEDYSLQSNLVFADKLIHLLDSYYHSDLKIDIMEALVLELCRQTDSSGVAIFHHQDARLDVIVLQPKENPDTILFNNRIIMTEEQRSIRYEQDIEQISWGIKDAKEICWTLSLLGSKDGNIDKKCELIRLSIPVLRSMLVDQEQQRNRSIELNRNLSKMVSLQCLIESLDDIVLELNDQMVIRRVWVKDKTKLFIPPEQFMNKTLKEVFGEFGNRFIGCIEKLILTGERQECIYPDFDQKKHHWFCAKFQKIDTEHGEARIVCVIEDITSKKDMSDQLEQNALELRRMNLELIESKNLAEQIARKRTEILSIMSHEIRTPLNGIIGICNLLNQSLFSDPKTIEYIDHLNFSSNHLLHLVNDILDLEKIESRKMELSEKETDLISLVRNIGKQFTPMAEAKGLKLEFFHNEGIPKCLMIDDLRLSRILNNLIGNAIKFTDVGGVSISLEKVKLDAEWVGILFKVSDTGIGIPEHLHYLVFDKFHQVQQASHREQQGTGLGLSITKGLINLFKSEIYLRSKPFEGTTFEFQIDFKIGGVFAEKTPDITWVGHRSLPDFDLLIVDDNPVNLLVASHQLDRFGIKADQASSGYAALKRMEEKKFDVVLVDLHMPGMDGYELSKRIQLEYPQTKVIVFTADILEEVRTRLGQIGVLHILSKPFKPEEMHELLLRVLEEQ
ncbi:response regulator [Pedobacter nutrimenti]|uniref:response regulator n=1 Tax=Pedobacter nutrimenti TaxID=1241337 RepID=UPI002931E8E0|nr:response regulator [Pedobacter nutrimenti]